MPYTNAVGATYDSGHYEANMDLRHAYRRLGRASTRRGAAAKARGRLLGLGLANYVESSIGAPRERAEITVPPDGTRRRRDRHAAERPGARDELRAGHRRSARRAGRRACASSSATPTSCSVGGGSHSGRSMRHAATVFAQGRDGDLIAQGQGDRRAGAGDRRPTHVTFVDGRFGAPDTNRTFDFLELAREAARTRARRRAQRRPRRRHRQRDARPGVSQRLRGRARSRSIPRPARSSSRATPRSTTSGAASIR